MGERAFRYGWIVTLALVVGTAAVSTALADLTVTFKRNEVESKMYLTPDKLCAMDPEGIMIFDSSKKVMKVIDPKEKTVTEMTQDQLKQMSQMASAFLTPQGEGQAGDDAMAQYGDMMAEARKQAMEAIKDLPEEQRKMAEEQINKQFGGLSAAAGGSAAGSAAGTPGIPGTAGPMEETYVPMDRSEKINGYSCKGYTIMKGEAKVGEVWTASLEDLKISRDDVAVFQKLRAFFADALEGNPFISNAMSQFNMFDPESDEFIGVPVRRVDIEGSDKTVTELISVDKGKVDAKVFEAGAGFKKQSLMGG